MPYSLSIKNDRKRLPTTTHDRLADARKIALDHSKAMDMDWVMSAEGMAVSEHNGYTYTIFHWSAT